MSAAREFSLFKETYTSEYKKYSKNPSVRIILDLVKLNDLNRLRNLDSKDASWIFFLLIENEFNILTYLENNMALADCCFEWAIKLLEIDTNTKNLGDLRLQGFSIWHWLAVLNPSKSIVTQFLSEFSVPQDCYARLLEDGHHNGFFTEGGIHYIECTPLYMAARAGHLRACQILIEHGAELNTGVGSRRDNETPFYAAAKAGHVSVLELLYKNGADYQSASSYYKPITVAAEFERVDAVRYLLSIGATTAVRGYISSSKQDVLHPLCAAAVKDNSEIVELLLNANADLIVGYDNFRLQSFFYALREGRVKAVKKFIELRPDLIKLPPDFIDSESYKRQTPLEFARQRGFSQIVEMLEEAGQQPALRLSR